MTAHGASAGSRRRHGLWLALLLLLLGTPGHAAEEAGFRIVHGSTRLSDGVYYLNARIDYKLTDAAREALANGVPLVVELQIQVMRRRWWGWWNAEVAELSQRYRLQYHALSQRYVLTALNSGESRSFRTQAALLAALGNVNALPLIDAQLLDKRERYLVRLRARLDLDALPRPLRTVAYISPDWRLVSDWHQWQINS